MVIMGFWIWKDMKEKSARTSGQWILVLSYEFSVCLYLLEFRMLQLLFFFFLIITFMTDQLNLMY